MDGLPGFCVVHLCLHLVVTVGAASDYFCETFYSDIVNRDPLRFSIPDNTPAGTVLKQFERHAHEKNTVFFNSGDLTYMDFDKSKFALVTKAPMYPKADQTLQIFGNCTEHIQKINYGFSLSLTVLLDVRDVNDPPVFGNLPAYLRIKESVRVGSLLYKVVMKEGFDVREDFATAQLRLTNVTAEGFPDVNAARFFSLDPDGSIYLQQPIDYETDPRKFEIAIHAEDLGSPPLMADSSISFYIQDMDDNSPRFEHKTFHATLVGEKPIKTPECDKTEPEIFAEDQDIREKSEVHYEISAGPQEGEDWHRLFKLEETSGKLCQLATIERTVPDPLSGRLTFANYTFRIKGYQVDNRRKYDTAELVVHVADSNLHKPSFDRKLYRASIPEYPGINTSQQIIQVKATDKDHGRNSVFEYELEGPGARWFSVDSESGWITVSEPARLDREIYNSFEFKVKATETSTLEKLWSEARVVITLEDLNDHTPQFEHYRYSYTVKDSLHPGSPVHTTGAAISAYDSDMGDNGRVLYSITSTARENGEVTFNDFGRFTVDPDEGTLRLAGSLNDLRRHRVHPVYRLEVTATDQARKKKDRRSSSVRVTIQVEEANDFLPIITPVPGSVRINESEPVGSLVRQIEVHDRDGDEDVYIKYKIHGNRDDAFSISSGGRVVINRPLDRETREFYKLRIEVSDGQHRKTTTLRVQVLDVNDNSPVFTQEEYVFSVSENPSPGDLLGHVTATDSDTGSYGSIHYSVKFAPGAELIDVRPDGRVVVRQGSSLWDRELNSYIRLKLIASDRGKPPHKAFADMVIRITDVNDNAPVFTTTHYHGWVEEDDTNPKPQIINMDIPINATDADADFANRDIRYSLSSDGSDIFQMDPVRADVITANIGHLDAEKQQTYELTITATDQGGTGHSSTARLTITVRDLNDNTPRFTGPSHYFVPSNTARGHKVATLQVEDHDVTTPNNHLIFILKEGGQGKFTVDFENGDIILVDRLDKEPVLPVYELLIQALDGGVPRLTNQSKVTIRVPMNRPPIIRTNTTNLQVNEGLPTGTLVGTMLADDIDLEENAISGNVEFFIMDNTVPFEVTPHGLIRTKGSLDREKQKAYEFQLYVKDEGHPPMTSSTLVRVLIDDVNDHPPEFVNDPYEGTVVEDDVDPNPSQRVKLHVNISVIDRDDTSTPDDVRYSLHGDHQSSMFHINPKTGEVKVSTYGFGLIDREKTERFQLKVRATDHGGHGLSSDADLIIHVIDVNDVTPKFRKRKKRLEVPRHVEVGQVIGALSADDGDATKPNNLLIYTLENDPYGKFSVDSHTGEVKALTGVFYPPRQGSYQLKVAATDMGFPPRRTETTAEIYINKTDFNDHTPEFHGETIFYVHEEVPVGTLVGTVTVTDADDDAHHSHVKLAIHADGPVPFKINSKTGEIRNSAVLDYDTGGRAYTFTVAAHDWGDPPRTAQMAVGVIIDDINDNPPRFTQARYHHRVHTLFPPGTLVSTPFAYDDVDSSSSVYRYKLLGPGAGLYFYIDEHTGAVRTTAEPLEDISGGTVEYKLVVEDVYNRRLGAEAALVIDVLGQAKSTCCCKVPCESKNPP